LMTSAPPPNTAAALPPICSRSFCVRLRSRQVVLGNEIRAASLSIEHGKIADIGPYEIDAPDYPAILPGLIDTHVHINEPGRTEWEGFETATLSAKAGGITTLVDMPLNSVPSTTTVAALELKREATRGKCHVRTEFWGGVVPGNAHELGPLLEAGVRGFKCFLTPSGTPDFDYVTETDLRVAMPHLQGAVLQVHCELPEYLISKCDGDPYDYATYLRSRPRESEHEAIGLMIRLAREFNARVHIVHLSSADALPLLRNAPITVETCPHYLTFDAEHIPRGATRYKCAPPIREHENRERLWEALRDGTISMIVSDHSPAPPDLKQGDFLQAWGGISSLQLGLPIVWTEARKRGFTLAEVARWMSANPAKLAGFSNKGRIDVGYDADLTLFDPEATFAVDARTLHHRHKLTPYDGLELQGKVLDIVSSYCPTTASLFSAGS
jgi:allantoinase